MSGWICRIDLQKRYSLYVDSVTAASITSIFSCDMCWSFRKLHVSSFYHINVHLILLLSTLLQTIFWNFRHHLFILDPTVPWENYSCFIEPGPVCCLFALGRDLELCEDKVNINLWRMLLVSHSQLVCCIAYRNRGLCSRHPPPHNNGNVMNRSRQWANRNEIQIGNCTCLTLSYCFMVNVYMAEGGQIISVSLIGS